MSPPQRRATRYSVAQSAAEPVAKIGQVEYTDLHEAVDAVKNGETLELLCNVDLAGVDWVPVTGFNGTIDGKGFIISNLTVNASGDGVGFIGSAVSLLMHDLTFANANVTASSGNKHAVILGTFHPNGATFENVNVVDSTLSAVKYVGLFVGNTSASTTFSNVKALRNTITASDVQVGALCGYTEGGITATDVEISGNTITGGSKVGALWGRTNGGWDKNFVNVVVDQPNNALIGGMYKGVNIFTGDDTDVKVNAFYNTQEGTGTASIKAGTWSLDPTEYVPEVGYKVTDNGDGTWTVEALAAIALTISAENATVTGIEAGTVYEGSNLTFTVAANTGYKLVDVKANGVALTDTEGVYTYAVTGEETEKALAIVVTVEEDAQPVVPGADIDIPQGADPEEFAALIESQKDKLLKAPGDVETTPLYRSYFTATVVGTKVEFVLNKTGEDALQAQVNTDVTTADVAKDLVDATAAAATVTTTPGFYYYVVGGTEVGTIATKGERKLATTGSTELQKPDLGTTTKAFYKIGVDYK